MLKRLAIAIAGCGFIGLGYYTNKHAIKTINKNFNGVIVKLSNVEIDYVPDNYVWLIKNKNIKTDNNTQYLGNKGHVTEYIFSEDYLKNFNYVGTAIEKISQVKPKYCKDLYVYMENDIVKYMYEDNVYNILNCIADNNIISLSDALFITGVGFTMTAGLI